MFALRLLLPFAVVATLVGPGCKNGIVGGGKTAEGEGESSGEGEGEEAEGEGEGEGEDPNLYVGVADAPRQLRLLSGTEYQNTVRDLLHIEANALDHGDSSSGFDSGSGTHLDENLLSVLLIEAERLAHLYVDTRIQQDFVCADRANITNSCVEEIVDTLAPRAFRRPLTAEERASLLGAFVRIVDEDDEVQAGDCNRTTQEAGHFEVKDGRCRASCGVLGGTNCAVRGDSCAVGTGPVGNAHDCTICCGPGGTFVDDVRVNALYELMTRLLMSSGFLYRTEIGDGGGVLSAFERASLLSYTLTGSMPDAPLWADAQADVLDDAKVRGHVRRLFATEAGRTRLLSFLKQWARVTDLDAMVKNPAAWPKLTGQVQAEQLRDEFHAFASATALQERGTLRALMTSTDTFVGSETAALYGVAPPAGPGMTRASLSPAERSGLLTLASVMTVHANAADADRDRPVKRGLLVYNKMLCGVVGLPSGLDTATAGREAASRTPDFESLTTRGQFEAMMQQNNNCMMCHQDFMPFGYAFGSYDGLGRHRTTQRERPIDTSMFDVQLGDGVSRNFADAPTLLREVAESRAAAGCFARNLVAFTIGKNHGADVDTLAEALTDTFAANDTVVVDLIAQIVASPSLRRRSTP